MTYKEFLNLYQSSIGAKGGDPQSTEAYDFLNKARAIAYEVGDWHGLYEYVGIPVTGSFFCLPWKYERIMEAWQRVNNPIPTSDCCYSFFVAYPRDCCGHIPITDLQSYAPSPVPFPSGYELIIKASDRCDNDKEITIVYENRFGSIVSEVAKLDAGKLQSTEKGVKTLISIVKPPTKGAIKVLYKKSTEECVDLFWIYPQQTSVQYKEYCSSCLPLGGCGCIIVKAKKKFYPVAPVHEDFEIDLHSHALSQFMEAIGEKDKRTAEGLNLYRALVKDGIDFLKKQKEVQNNIITGDERISANSFNILGESTERGLHPRDFVGWQ